MMHHKKSLLADSKTISAQQLKDKLDSNSDSIVINVLDKETYVDCHITGSINIPYDALIETVASWDKDKDVVVYCAQNNCSKSKDAYDLLVDLGFSNIHEYQGGMREWFHKKFDTTGLCTLKYLHE
ncbi:rhodanese-like domain-containing protein [Candidatus Babeliales bacterium]|nr:rhodanese-like domain-containing protein [Candidatus Babeliales bacterium]